MYRPLGIILLALTIGILSAVMLVVLLSPLFIWLPIIAMIDFRTVTSTKKGECHIVGLGLLADAPLLLQSAVHVRYLRDLHDHDDVDDAVTITAVAARSLF